MNTGLERITGILLVIDSHPYTRRIERSAQIAIASAIRIEEIESGKQLDEKAIVAWASMLRDSRC